jgi:hypothetical protein
MKFTAILVTLLLVCVSVFSRHATKKRSHRRTAKVEEVHEHCKAILLPATQKVCNDEYTALNAKYPLPAKAPAGPAAAKK